MSPTGSNNRHEEDEPYNPGGRLEREREARAAQPSQGKDSSSQKSDKSDDLATLEGEKTKTAGNGKSVEGEESNPFSYEGGSKNGGGKPKGSFFQRKKKGIIVSLITGAVAGTGISGLLYFVQLTQPIHIAKLLQEFHLEQHESTGDDRFYRLYKYLKSGRAEQTRLGVLGNRIGDRVEARFNEKGITSGYTQAFGFYDGFILDPATAPQFKDKSTQEVKDYYKQKYNVNLEDNGDGKLKIPAVNADGKRLGYFASRALIKDMLYQAGYGKISTAVHSRVMGKRAGVTWHPMKKLDQKVLRTAEERFLKWKEDREKRIALGDDAARASLRADNDSPVNEDGTPVDPEGNQNAEEATSNVEDIQKEAEEARSGGPGKLEQFQKSLGGRLTLGTANVTAVLCLGKAVIQQANETRHTQTVLPLIRIGWEAVSLGWQLTHGKDVDLEQLGFFNRSFYDPETKTDWYAARSVQAEVGNELSGPDVGSEAKPSGLLGQFAFLEKQPVTALCSAGVQGPLTVISFLGGPVTGLAGLVVSGVVGPVFTDKVASLLAGKAVDLGARGPTYGNYINYGVRYAANDIGASSGGHVLTKAESFALSNMEKSYAQEEFTKKSLAYKLFNPQDPRSLLAQTVVASGSRLSQDVATVATLGNVMGALLPKLPSGSAASAQQYDYGFQEVGFNTKELNNPAFENPYENAETVVRILEGDRGQEYIDRIKKCNELNIGKVAGKDGAQVWGVTSTGQVPKQEVMEDGANKCAEDNLEWKRVQFFALDTGKMEAVACFEGEKDACDNVGFGNKPAGGAAAPGGNGSLADCGTVQQCAQKVLDHPGIIFDPGVEAQMQQAAQSGTVNGVAVKANVLKVLLAIADQGIPLRLGDFVRSASDHHGQGRAIDIGNEEVAGRVMPFLHSNKDNFQIDQLIYASPPSGTTNLLGGQPHKYSAGTISEHANHIHYSVK